MIDFDANKVMKLKKDRNTTHENSLQKILVDNEEFISSYSSGRDYIAFTNKRIITINVQGITGKKIDYTSLPYSKITCFSIETAGLFDRDAELQITLAGVGTIKFEFAGSCDIEAIAKNIGYYVLF